MSTITIVVCVITIGLLVIIIGKTISKIVDEKKHPF